MYHGARPSSHPVPTCNPSPDVGNVYVQRMVTNEMTCAKQRQAAAGARQQKRVPAWLQSPMALRLRKSWRVQRASRQNHQSCTTTSMPVMTMMSTLLQSAATCHCVRVKTLSEGNGTFEYELTLYFPLCRTRACHSSLAVLLVCPCSSCNCTHGGLLPLEQEGITKEDA